MTMSRRTKQIIPIVVALIIVGISIWASDRITLQGERTIYTVNCVGGNWVGNNCTGRLVADKRYGFRSSPSRHEVIYWVRGSGEPSGRFANCTVVDRDNWSCPETANEKTPIAHEMRRGRPMRGDSGKAVSFHDVAKWKWWLIESGVPGFTDALN